MPGGSDDVGLIINWPESGLHEVTSRHFRDSDIGLLKLLSEQSAQAQNDPQQLASLNRKFHQTIYAAAHNQYLLQTRGQLENALALLCGTTYAVDGRAQTADAEHHAIVDVILPARCRSRGNGCTRHIASAQSVRLRLILQEDEA